MNHEDEVDSLVLASRTRILLVKRNIQLGGRIRRIGLQGN